MDSKCLPYRVHNGTPFVSVFTLLLCVRCDMAVTKVWVSSYVWRSINRIPPSRSKKENPCRSAVSVKENTIHITQSNFSLHNQTFCVARGFKQHDNKKHTCDSVIVGSPVLQVLMRMCLLGAAKQRICRSCLQRASSKVPDVE